MEIWIETCEHGWLWPPSPVHLPSYATQNNNVKKCVFEWKSKVQTMHRNCRVALEISEHMLTKSDLQHLTNHHSPLIPWVQTPSSRGSSPDICPAKPSCHLLLRSQSQPQHCLNISATTLALNSHLGTAIQHLHVFNLKLYLGENGEVAVLFLFSTEHHSWCKARFNLAFLFLKWKAYLFLKLII